MANVAEIGESALTIAEPGATTTTIKTITNINNFAEYATANTQHVAVAAADANANNFANGTMLEVENDNADGDEEDEEKDLTNLNWLTELRNQTLSWPNAAMIDDDPAQAACATSGAVNTSSKPTVGMLPYADHDGADVGESGGVALAVQTKEKCSNNNKVNKRTFQLIAGSSALLNNCDGRANNKTKNSNSNKQHHISQQQQQQLKRPTPAERYEIFLNKIKRDLTEYENAANNYETNTTEKPPFNYSHIIGMSMLERGRVTLQQICAWIESKFAYFRVRKKWNNSIRHNLSLHHCFRKIDRNKYEKGKGGYWELGVDPRKCDRKRIRNRKSPSQTHKNKQKQQYLSSQRNNSDDEQSKDKKAATANCVAHCFRNTSSSKSQLADTCPEELYLDELDVQQNIDVSSCNQQAIFHQQQQQQHQYQLGTIIISTATAAGAITDVAASDVAAFNCMIRDNAVVGGVQQQQHQNILYAEHGADISSMCENVIISSYLSNHDRSLEACDVAKCNSTANSISTNSMARNADAAQQPAITQRLTQRPNVIVEQLTHPATLEVTGTAHMHAHNPISMISSNCDYAASIVNDNFRPYIDGIEEAFQYLRSMDTNRGEDLLDNLLDISVSDY